MQKPFFVWGDNFLETMMAVPFEDVRKPFIENLALEKINYAKVYGTSKENAVSKYINAESKLLFTDVNVINVIASEGQLSKQPI